MKNRFCIKRCSQVLRWLVSVNRVTLLGLFAGAAVGMFLIEMVMYLLHTGYTPSNYLNHIRGFMVFGLAALVLTCVSCAFTNFTQIGSKQQRTNFLMLPASDLEKFLAVVLLVTFVYLTVGILGFVVGDSLRMGVMAAWNQLHPLAGVSYIPEGDGTQYTYWWSSALPKVLAHLNPDIPINGDYFIYGEGNSSKMVQVCSLGYTVVRYALFVAFLAWVHSLFMLGGTQLRRYAFVASGLVFLLAVWLYAQGMTTFDLDLYNDTPYYAINKDGFAYLEHDVHTLEPMAYVTLILLVLLTCFNYWASFHVFKHFELITNKWTNYDILKR